MLRARDQRFVRGELGASEPAPVLLLGLARRKMCIVSEADDTQSRVEVRLNDMLYMVEGMVPRRNWKSF
jgi:hypothetical protein